MRVGMVAAIFVLGFVAGSVANGQKADPPAGPAERVTGIGGIFFKARDPKALGEWYREKLGVMPEKGGFSLFRWRDHADPKSEGTTVWALFPATTKYFGPDASLMINYRVANLDRMLAQLRAAGVKIEPKVEDDFNGRFAHIFDPEGNRIQLWEPKPGY